MLEGSQLILYFLGYKTSIGGPTVCQQFQALADSLNTSLFFLQFDHVGVTNKAKRQKNDRSYAKRFWRPGGVFSAFRFVYN